jgi:hypothetical protein
MLGKDQCTDTLHSNIRGCTGQHAREATNRRTDTDKLRGVCGLDEGTASHCNILAPVHNVVKSLDGLPVKREQLRTI